MRILYVCTANICRSPSAAALLRDEGISGVEVRSAGTAATQGAPGCSMAAALRDREPVHTSQPLTAELVAWADLVHTAARDHQAVVLSLDPGARAKTFTIAQAGRLAEWLVSSGMLEAAQKRAQDPQGWAQRFEQGDPRLFVVPLPTAGEQTPAWLVSELDAARGLAPAAAVAEPQGRFRRRKDAEAIHPDDIPDPHELGPGWHEPAGQKIADATAELALLLRTICGPSGAG